jgi:hypothetical protein
MDGEGHITIGRSRPAEDAVRARPSGGRSRCNGTWHFILNIGMTSTDERLIKWIELHFGGKHYTDKRHQQNWKPALRWRVLGRKAQERLLLGILPYLVIKKEQAGLALDFIRMDGREDQAARTFFYERFMTLNRRGVSPETNTSAIPDGMKIEPGLHGNMQSVAVVIQ